MTHEAKLCNVTDCSTHEYVMNALNKFDNLASKLAEGQQQIQLNVVRLTEHMDNTKRLHDRVDKLERFMWKSVGLLSGLVFLASIIVPVLMKVFLGI